MNNFEQFNILVDEYLEQDKTYELQIKNFKNFLVKKNLQNQVFNLERKNIDDFFEDSFTSKIGAEPTLTAHIAALKSLFSFLISKEYNFSNLNGYINALPFKQKMLKNVAKSITKSRLSNETLTKILEKLDKYIDTYADSQSNKKIYFETLIARLFIKLSLILPLKASQMLDIHLGDIMSSSFRCIQYNDIVIRIPNNLRKDILYTINYAEKLFNKKYSPENGIFHFLYSCSSKKAITSVINETLTRVYKKLDLNEMLETIPVGKKEMHIYTAECYKLTSIANMLENGVNIVYLTKLTDLDIGTLVSVVDMHNHFEKKDVVSIDINNGILSSGYYEYL